MASQRYSNFPPSPNKKTRTKQSKRRPEDDADHARPKKNKRSQDVPGSQADEDQTGEERRRTKRSGAGSGGRVSQMEKIGITLEMAAASRPRKVTDVAEDLPDNPLAPPKKQKRRKAQSSNPPPYPSGVAPPGLDYQEVGSRSLQLNPQFYHAQNRGRFGFSTDLPPIVPPGTEPDLQAINNPYGAVSRTQAAAIPASSTQTISGRQSRPLSDSDRRRDSGPPKQLGPQSGIPIDPVLMLQSTRPPSSSFPSRSHPRSTVQDEESSQSKYGSESEEKDSTCEGEGDDDDDMSDIGWAATGQARDAHPGFRLETGSLATTRHYTLPEPDHEFQHSRDEDEDAAQSALRGNDGAATDEFVGEDVLEQHYTTNGRPSVPAPEQLTSLAQRSQAETAPSKVRAPRNSKKSKDASPASDSLGFYPATWKDCLEDAKKECRAAHALHNPFPSRARDLDISISESLVTVVVEWTKRGTAFQPGFWPDHKRDMAAVLLGDMSTWRSELKKIAIAHAPAAFNLTPPPGTAVQARATWTEDAASKLLEQSMFLRDGFDQNGKTNNFAHPSLKYALIEFFYTGSYRTADKRPNIFRSSVPLPCLALVGAAYNCALDGFAKNGSGKSFPNFSGKSYNSVFRAMLGMLQDIEKDAYHGAKLQAQLMEWGTDGWNALQGIDATVGRHNHLQIALD